MENFKKKKFLLTPFSAAWKMINDFTMNSTVHGVKYLGERKRHWSERVFWVLVFLLSVAGCSTLIIQMWDKWQNGPLIPTQKETPVWELAFPAITICPETKVIYTMLNFTKCYKIIKGTKFGKPFNLTKKELFRLDALAQVCESDLLELEKLHGRIRTNEIVQTLREIGPNLNSTFRKCTWERKVQHCENIFTQLITEEGSCFTFNMLNSTDIFRDINVHSKFETLSSNNKPTHWSPQERYSIPDEDTNPRRVKGLGKKSGLSTILVHAINNSDYTCRNQVQGYKVILHNPGVIPRVSKDFIRIPLNTDVSVIIKPKLVTTSQQLKEYDPKRRNCYFENERPLQFFKTYTQSNCQLECLTNFTLDACTCVKFSMPRINQTLICVQKQVKCYERAEMNFTKAESFNITSYRDKVVPKTMCDCLPSCTSIYYDYEITQFDLKFDGKAQVLQSKLSFFFRDGQVATRESLEFYGFKELIADSGGLMGLFMGVSLLSIIEIIYYFSLRLICNIDCGREIKPTTEKVINLTENNINSNYNDQIITFNDGFTYENSI